MLPRLNSLSLRLYLNGPLPAAWAGGFWRLQSLFIASDVPSRPPADGSQAQQPGDAFPDESRALPPEWSSGFPALRKLELFNLQLAGTFPRAWSVAGFPFLSDL